MNIKLCFFLSMILLISSCGTNRVILKEDNQLSKQLELPIIKNARPLLIIGDNQLNNIYTDASLFGLRLSDMLSHVAIRPPALNLYSPFLTRMLLNKYSNSRYVLHMGDALNISCQNEWTEFSKIMNGSENKGWNWVMVPGNHDSNFYGVTSGGWWHNTFSNRNWAEGCVGSNGAEPIFEKKDFISSYLEHIKSSIIRDDFVVEEKEKEIGLFGFNVNVYTAEKNEGFYRKVIAYEYQNFRKHRSFIVQFVRLSKKNTTPIIGVLIDTTNYDDAPTNTRGFLFGGLFGKNAGLKGYVDDEQIQIIRNELDLISGKNPNMEVVIFGHHDYDSLNSDAKCFFEELAQKYIMKGYVSAHTHSGFVKPVYSNDDSTNEIFIEYNIGSVIDWPLQVGLIKNNHSEIKIIDTADITDVNGNYSKWCKSKYDYSTNRVSNYTAYRRDAHTINLFKIGQQSVNAQQNLYLVALIRAYIDLNIVNMDEETKTIHTELFSKFNEECEKNRQCQDGKRILIDKAKEKLLGLIGTGSLLKSDFYEYASCQALFSSKAEYLSYSANHESNLD